MRSCERSELHAPGWPERACLQATRAPAANGAGRRCDRPRAVPASTIDCSVQPCRRCVYDGQASDSDRRSAVGRRPDGVVPCGAPARPSLVPFLGSGCSSAPSPRVAGGTASAAFLAPGSEWVRAARAPVWTSSGASRGAGAARGPLGAGYLVSTTPRLQRTIRSTCPWRVIRADPWPVARPR